MLNGIIGIVVFAGESFVQCPLTLDYGAAKMFLMQLPLVGSIFRGPYYGCYNSL